MNESTMLRIIECAEAVERACLLRALAVKADDLPDVMFWVDSAQFWADQAFVAALS